MDGSGNAYVSGQAFSSDFPAGAFQTIFAGDERAFVTKVTPNGSGLIYSTYLGGSSDDSGRGIVLDGAGTPSRQA